MPNALRLAEIVRALPSAVPRAAKNTLLAYYFKTFAAVGEIDRSIGKSSSMFYCFAPPISRNPAMTLRKSKSSRLTITSFVTSGRPYLKVFII